MMARTRDAAAGGRLAELDALRGLAALAVVLFHFTTRFDELYPQPSRFQWSGPRPAGPGPGRPGAWCGLGPAARAAAVGAGVAGGYFLPAVPVARVHRLEPDAQGAEVRRDALAGLAAGTVGLLRTGPAGFHGSREASHARHSQTLEGPPGPTGSGVHLAQVVRANRVSGLQPDLVLWQQGEADAKAGTTPERYAQRLLALTARVDAGGLHVPILMALSTVCRSAPDVGLRNAVLALAARHARFMMGPDTDAIEQRHDGCHWSASGRAQAASLWASAIAKLRPGQLPALRE